MSENRELKELLTRNNLGHIYSPLSEHGIRDLELLKLLNYSDLPNFGITLLADRNRLWEVIKKLQGKQEVVSAFTTPAKKSSESVFLTPQKPATPSLKTNLFGSPALTSLKEKSRVLTPLASLTGKLRGMPIEHIPSISSPSTPTKFMKFAIANNSTANAISSFVEKKSIGDRIKVCVRKRPLNSKELAKKEKDVVEVKGNKVIVKEPK